MSGGFRPNLCPQCGANIRQMKGPSVTECPYCGTSLITLIEVPGPRESAISEESRQAKPSPENIARIADGLRQIYTRGGEGNFIIISADKEKNYYIQFLAGRGCKHLTAEAVGNQYLSEENALDQSQQQKLLDLGWDPSYEDPRYTKNYHRFWEAESDSERNAIAEEIALTFNVVYGIPAEKSVEVEVVFE